MLVPCLFTHTTFGPVKQSYALFAAVDFHKGRGEDFIKTHAQSH